MTSLTLRLGSVSIQGLRPSNQDRFVVDLENRLFLVADGMGGQEHGELASSMAAEILPRVVKENLRTMRPVECIRAAFGQAHADILHASREQRADRRMGTTAVLALFHGDVLHIAGVGDSRIYHLRQGRLAQLTVDQTMAQLLASSGVYPRDDPRLIPYQRYLCQYLGRAEAALLVPIRAFDAAAGDRLLLASDGLTNHTTEDQLCSALQGSDMQASAEQLVQLALSNGSRDNVTCIAIAVEGE
jgi:serine/threonine protein phosphatase PrpC